jgi:hypothetical protein
MSATINGKKFCDCGDPSDLRYGGDWQCLRCKERDGNRYRSEREVARRAQWEIKAEALTADADLVYYAE